MTNYIPRTGPRPAGKPPMASKNTRPPDLETLIREKQDQLRCRPRNWRDDLSDWWSYQDVGDMIFMAVLIVLFSLSAIPGVWLMLLLQGVVT